MMAGANYGSQAKARLPPGMYFFSFFKSSVRFTAKLSRRYRDFLCTPALPTPSLTCYHHLALEQHICYN